MHRLNLLRHKRSVRRHWELKLRRPEKRPEVVMEGEHVIHTDEDGNILLDQKADQWIDQKRQAIDEFDELFEALEEDPDGKGRELAEKVFKEEAVFFERMRNTIGPFATHSQKATSCSNDKSLKPRTIIGDTTD